MTYEEPGKIEGINHLAWAFALAPAVPFACIMITWVAGWIAIGNPNLIGHADPGSIMIFPLLAIPGLLFVIVEMVQAMLHRRSDAIRMLIPALLWGISLIIFTYDPGEVIEWFWD